MAGTRLLGSRGLAPALGRVQRGLAAHVVAKAEGGGKANKSKGKKDEGGKSPCMHHKPHAETTGKFQAASMS